MYPTEAEAILTAAEVEGAGAGAVHFPMQSDGSSFSGRDPFWRSWPMREPPPWASTLASTPTLPCRVL